MQIALILLLLLFRCRISSLSNSLKSFEDTVLDMINTAYHGKPLIFIGATFRDKLVSHHQAVNMNF